jgi:hypothetical protein
MVRPSLRRWAPYFLAGAGAVLLYALAGFLLVPWIIERQVRSQAADRLSREASVDEVSFNPFTLAATMTGFRLEDRDSADLVTVGRLHIDFQVSGVFRRAYRFRELRIERPVLSPRILADGKLSVADLFAAKPTDGAGGGLPRVIVDRLTVSDGVVDFSDASRSPAYRSRLEPLNLDVTDLITLPSESGAHTLAIGVGAGAVLKWTGRQMVDPLRFTGELEITQLELPRLWEYFAAHLPFDLASGRADLTVPYEIARTSGGAFDLKVENAGAELREISLRPRGSGPQDATRSSVEAEEWLAAERVGATNVRLSWADARLSADRIAVTQPRALVRVESDGALNWSKAMAALTPREPSAAKTRPWTVRVTALDVSGGTASLQDTSVDPPVTVALGGVTLTTGPVSMDPAAPIEFRTSASVSGGGAVESSGTVEARGHVTPSPLAAAVTMSAARVDLVPVRAYVRTLPGARLASGRLSVEGRVAMSPGAPRLTVSGGGTIEDVEVQDASGGRLVSWTRMAVRDLTYTDAPARARVRTVVLDQAFAKIHIDGTGRLNLTSTGGTAAASGAVGGRSAPGVEIGVVEFRDGSAEFTDESLLLPFRAAIHSATGSIRDLSTFSAAPATLAVEGRVDRTGFVKADGTLRVADPMAASEITLGFRSIEMPGLTPYFAQFAGYAVNQGVLDLDVRYVVKDRRLVGNHSVVARDLVLGNRVKDSKAPSLPIRLAVALLKDREGRINLDVPIQGTVDSPEFAYRTVFWAAVRTILGNVARAPFRALGRLFGRDQDDLELVEFEPGRSDLLPAEQETLTRLAEQIGSRAELTIALEGRFDPAADTAALKRSRLDALIETRRTAATAAAAAAGGSTLENILESLFAERFSAADLETERKRFLPAAAPTPEAAPPAAAAGAAASPAANVPPRAEIAVGPQAGNDSAAFYESLRARLLEAQTVSDDDLSELGTARAASMRTALLAGGAVTADRVTLSPPTAAKRRRAGSDRIASEMTMGAGDE